MFSAIIGASILAVAGPVPKATFLILLVRPANATSYPPEKLQEIQAAHLKHLGDHYNLGHFRVAGPMMIDQPIRGVVVAEADSLRQAKEYAEADPAVRANRLAVEVYPWQIAPVTYGKPIEPMKLVTHTMVLIDVSASNAGRPALLPAEARAKFLKTLRPTQDYLLSGPITGRAKYADCFVIPGPPTPDLEEKLRQHPIVRSGTGRPVILPWASGDGVLPAPTKQ
ncbi:MAG: YciI family protein [Fimbriimonadaceae bacterium]|nr:YciI family protein [Fimbriimonadaceae bacterium]